MSPGAARPQAEPITAIVLIHADSSRIAEIGERIADVRGVAEAYTVAGEWDFVAIVRAHTHDELVGVVTEELNALPGVQRTLTLIAFKRYSRYALSRMWSLGLEAGDSASEPDAGPDSAT